MKFYDCSTAPSPRRVRMFIAEKCIDIDVVQIDLGKREQHSDQFTKINPHRTVPVLELDNGRVLTSSTAIIHYLESCYPDPPLIGTSAEQRALIMDVDWRIEQEGFMAVGEALRNRAKSFAKNALTGRYEHVQIPELVERGALRTQHFFVWLEDQLATNRFIAGDRFSLADITAFVTVEFAQWIKQQPGSEQVNINRWYREVKERKSAAV